MPSFFSKFCPFPAGVSGFYFAAMWASNCIISKPAHISMWDKKILLGTAADQKIEKEMDFFMS
jgi:hypothetical protein